MSTARRKEDAESVRLAEDGARLRNWKRWGPYLADRQWGTVREDYSADGTSWQYFPHDHARSRAYRWGEDGLLGITDREGRLCLAVTLWNGRDPILKERLFGLTGPQGNHGEDVKECYFHLDSTPTHSYLKALYKYPQVEFPYAQLVEENARRGKHDGELELVDTGVFDGDRYFDVTVEYAKASPDDVVVRYTIANRGPEAATLHVLPTVWFRNTWSWGRTGEGYWPKPRLARSGDGAIAAEHASLGCFRVVAEGRPQMLFTENETNVARLFGAPNASPWVKDAFHEYVVHGRVDAVNPAQVGTKAAFHYVFDVPAGGEVAVRVRLTADGEASAPSPAAAAVDAVIAERAREAEAFYARRMPPALDCAERGVIRQAYAGLLWAKKFFYYVVKDWLEGDPAKPAPPARRRHGRNAEWTHLYNRDVISVPEGWEYPWYAAWDLAFHMLPLAQVDPAFAKEQLVLFTREWYMHPSGQLPAYEFGFGDVNPPVHAWAAWRVYKMAAPRGGRDRVFLSRVFQKLALNFTWWVNRKDTQGNNLFGGGFLGLDNIGVFDRSRPLPGGGTLEQADGTAWMAFYCVTMLEMALELARDNPACEDMASKFFEHFIGIVDAINRLGGTGLWCPEDGFYYDQLHVHEHATPLRVRSMVGLLPLMACTVLDEETLARHPAFAKRLCWFLENRPDLACHVVADRARGYRLLAIPSREQLERTLRYMLDETEFLSPHGLRSLSKVHEARPFSVTVDGEQYEVHYTPAESDSWLFGGNSNWRGPVWFPVNYLLVEALERYDRFYGDTLRIECPTGSGNLLTLGEVAREISRRLATLFVPGADGRRPCHGADPRFRDDPHWCDLVTFAEYFCGDTGRGIGARYQGWTALAIHCFEDLAKGRERRAA